MVKQLLKRKDERSHTCLLCPASTFKRRDRLVGHLVAAHSIVIPAVQVLLPVRTPASLKQAANFYRKTSADIPVTTYR
jgi:hypothetical protein